MGRIGKLIKTEIEKFIIATVETRFKYNQTADFYAASGDDAPPLENDRIALIGVDGTGNFAAIGVLMVSQGAEPGERILYSRDSDGNVQAVLKLLGDGSIEGISPGGYKLETEKDLELKTDGDTKVEASGDVGIKGTNVKIEGQVEATGGTFKCKGTAAPTGTGCLCALSVCPVTGAPHVGDTASGT